MNVTSNVRAKQLFLDALARPESERAAFEKSIGQAQRLPGGLRGADSLGPMLALLAGEGASYMTGQVISLDGGVCMLGS